jgi:hypothetical protein
MAGFIEEVVQGRRYLMQSQWLVALFLYHGRLDAEGGGRPTFTQMATSPAVPDTIENGSAISSEELHAPQHPYADLARTAWRYRRERGSACGMIRGEEVVAALCSKMHRLHWPTVAFRDWQGA